MPRQKSHRPRATSPRLGASLSAMRPMAREAGKPRTTPANRTGRAADRSHSAVKSTPASNPSRGGRKAPRSPSSAMNGAMVSDVPRGYWAAVTLAGDETTGWGRISDVPPRSRNWLWST